jgi:hypothetical protein
MSSAFVPLTFLHTLVLSVTDAHCSHQAQVVTTTSSGASAQAVTAMTIHSPTRRRRLSQADGLSDGSQLSTNVDDLPTSPRTPGARLRNSSISMTASAPQHLLAHPSGGPTAGADEITPANLQGITGKVGNFDTSIPPKRDIRKFARRCPSLKIIRWTGRHGKGEWRIAAGASSLHANIDFVPVQSVEDEEAENLTLKTGADVENFILSRRGCNANHPGNSAEEPAQKVAETAPFTEEGERSRNATPTTTLADGSLSPLLKPIAARSEGAKSNASVKRLADSNARDMKGKASDAIQSVDRLPTSPKASKGKQDRSYAAISDPKSVTQATATEAPARMTVLGESNTRKKAPATSSHPNCNESLIKGGRTVTKIRDLDDGSESATIIIGQGKEMSTTSGAAGRRTKKKIGSLVAVRRCGL